jgi:hypothetical protein
MGSFGSTPKQEPTAVERDQLRIAQDTWDRYKQSFRPIEDAMIEKIRQYEQPGYRENKAGEAAIAARRGVAPGGAGTSGRFLSGAMQSALGSGALASQGAAQTGLQAHQKYLGGLQGMTQLGHNERQQASQGTTRLAGIENAAAARKAALAAAEQENFMQGLGQLGGYGMSAMYNMKGNTGGADPSNILGNSAFIGPPASAMQTAAIQQNPFMPQFNW